MTADTSIYLVDASSFIYRAYHAIRPLQTRTGVMTNAVYGFASMLLKLIDERKPGYLGAVFDAPGPNFRHELYEGYKAERAPAPEDLRVQFPLCREIAAVLGIHILEEAGVEADDVLATAASHARQLGRDVVIVAADKDLMQLVGPRVVLWDTMRDAVFDEAAVRAKFGVGPAQLRDLLALVGDKSDSVPGVDGIGPKTAAGLLAEHGDLEGVLAAAPGIKGKRGKTLVEQAERARLSATLVSLRDDLPLDLAEADDPLGALRWSIPDIARVQEVFSKLEFDRLLTSSTFASATGAEGLVPVRASGVAIDVSLYRTVRDLTELTAIVRRAQSAGEWAFFLTCAGTAGTPLLVGVGLAWGEGEAAYIPIAHRALGTGDQLGSPEVLDALRPLLAPGDTGQLFVADTKQLHRLVTAHGSPVGRVACDPVLASYLLDSSEDRHDLPRLAKRHLAHDMIDAAQLLGTGKRTQPFDEIDVESARNYAGEAAEVTWLLGRQLRGAVENAGLAVLHDHLEVPLTRVLARMEDHGVLVDDQRLAVLSDTLASRIAELEAKVEELSGMSVNLASPKQLQYLLFDHLRLEPVRKTKTGYSTDSEALEELASAHPVAAVIHEHRSLQKLKGTYVDPLPKLRDSRTGRIHTSYHQAVAATGRLSSSDPNLQNIPIRTEIGRQIRAAFVAPDGEQIVSADYSQIELRVLAHLSRDARLLESFARDEDVHRRTAAEVFGVAPEQVTREQRRVAKAVNFGVIYGQTPFGLSRQLKIPKAEAKAHIERYFERYHGVAAYLDAAIEEARRTGRSTTLLGRHRPIDHLRSRNYAKRAAAERIARNTPIQGSAADIIKRAMLRCQARLERDFPRAAMILTVHDELVFEAPSDVAESLAAAMAHEMRLAFTIDVALKVDVGIGPNWADAH